MKVHNTMTIDEIHIEFPYPKVLGIRNIMDFFSHNIYIYIMRKLGAGIHVKTKIHLYFTYIYT
jgi:hypothetical protein